MSSETASHSGSVQSSRPRRLPLFWRILSYLFLFIFVNLLANLARVGVDALGLPSLTSRFVFTLVYIGGVLYLTYIYRHFIDRKPWSSIGLTAPKERLSQLATGLVFGVLVVATVFGFEYGAHWIRIVGLTDNATASTLLVDSLLLSLGFGVCEEIVMRGYIFQNLGEGRPVWQATLITGLIFGAFHLLSVGFGVRGLTFFIFTQVLNVFLVYTRLATRSLWIAIGFHTMFDWVTINLGLGAVVLADQHLLQIERSIALPAEDLLSGVAVGLGIALFIRWFRGRKSPFVWNAPLTQDVQINEPLA